MIRRTFLVATVMILASGPAYADAGGDPLGYALNAYSVCVTRSALQADDGKRKAELLVEGASLTCKTESDSVRAIAAQNDRTSYNGVRTREEQRDRIAFALASLKTIDEHVVQRLNFCRVSECPW